MKANKKLNGKLYDIIKAVKGDEKNDLYNKWL